MFFLPVFAWMSLRDFAWQAELFFVKLASGRRKFERGNRAFWPLSCFVFCGMRVQTRNFLFGTLHVNLYFKLKPNTVFVLSVDVKHCRHVEHSF